MADKVKKESKFYERAKQKIEKRNERFVSVAKEQARVKRGAKKR